jgi:hypothetical protein
VARPRPCQGLVYRVKFLLPPHKRCESPRSRGLERIFPHNSKY